MTNSKHSLSVEACGHCDDSGYVEIASGGFWTGENMRFRHEICDCPCGDDVRRELRSRSPLEDNSNG